ncbi:MAG: hypothetical protein RL757_2096 [Bacteroidota bacterium]|jgi:Fe-S cluster biogenesis protein NfuA
MTLTDNKTDFLNKIENVLNDVRPFLQGDGGNIEIVDITEDMTLQLRWLGNCQSCSISSMTKASITQILQSKLPEIKAVEMV